MRQGRPAEALLVDLADLKRYLVPVKIKKGLAGFFTVPHRRFAELELIEGGKAISVAAFMELADGETFC